jgi:hypothetical protein
MHRLLVALFIMAIVAAVGGTACGYGGGGGQGSPAPTSGY